MSARKMIVIRIPAIRPAEIARLEQRLQITLPDHYRQFLLNYPSILIETRTELGWKTESVSDRQLRFSLSELAYYNEDVRKQGTPWTEHDGPWPEQFFVIGDDQCGNYWMIDLNSSGREVYFYDHELGTFSVVHRSVEVFARHLVRETRHWNREQRRRAKLEERR